MSYILDALKKAQAERELGRVPALESLAAAPSGVTRRDAAAGPPRVMHVLAWVMLAAALLAAGAAWWWWSRTSATGPMAKTPALASPAAAAPVTAAAAPAAPAHPSPAVAVLPPVLPPPSAPAVEPSPPAATPPVVEAKHPAKARPAVIPTNPTNPTTATTATTATTPAEPASATAVVALESLDAPTRARLPPLVNGGTIQSAARDQRMVILDGQVLREGDAITPELSVQRIEPQGVVLQLGASLGNRRVRLKP